VSVMLRNARFQYKTALSEKKYAISVCSGVRVIVVRAVFAMPPSVLTSL
jgi:hypothetical protein